MVIKQKINLNVNKVYQRPYLVKEILINFYSQNRLGYANLKLNKDAYIDRRTFSNYEKKYNTLMLYSQGAKKHITVKVFRENIHRTSGAKLNVAYLDYRPDTINLILKLKDENKILSEKIISLEDLY